MTWLANLDAFLPVTGFEQADTAAALARIPFQDDANRDAFAATLGGQ